MIESFECAGSEEVSCEFGSMKYYALCGFGGILSCGLTHTAVVPLDLVKCRIQVMGGKALKTGRFYLMPTQPFQTTPVAHLQRFKGPVHLPLLKLYDVTLQVVLLCLPKVEPEKYKSMVNGFRVTAREEGFRTLARGWAPTLIGYSMQGLCKFGFYEVFKILYSNMLGEASPTWNS